MVNSITQMRMWQVLKDMPKWLLLTENYDWSDTKFTVLEDRSYKEILEGILSRVSEWSKGAPQHDDLTAVVMKRTA